MKLLEANGNLLSLRNVYDERIVTRDNIDLVVDWPGCRANDELADLTAVPQTRFIGDCVAPRNLEIAISEALQAATEI